MEEFMPMRRCVPARRTKAPASQVLDEKRYASCSRMIWQAAKKASAVSGVPFEEMKAQADMLFVRACRVYDAERGAKFSTVLFSILHNGLITFGQREAKHNGAARLFAVQTDEESQDPFDYIADERAESAYRFRELYNSLSPDEMFIVDLALKGMAASIADIRKLALERFGFDKARVTKAVAGVQTLVRECA